MGQYFSGDEDNPSFSVGDPGNHIKSNRFAGKPWDSIPGKGCGWSIMQTAASKKCILHFQPVGFVLYIFLEVAQTSQPQRKGRETSTKSEQRQLLSQLRDVSNLYATKKEKKKKKRMIAALTFPGKCEGSHFLNAWWVTANCFMPGS